MTAYRAKHENTTTPVRLTQEAIDISGNHVAPNPKARKTATIVALIVTVAILCATAYYFFFVRTPGASGIDVFPEGYTISGVSVAGMMQSEAKEALRTGADIGPEGKALTVRIAGFSYELEAAALGAEPAIDAAVDAAAAYAAAAYAAENSGGPMDFYVGYTLDEGLLRTAVKKIADEVNYSSVSDTYDVRADAVILEKGQGGVYVDSEKLSGDISARFLSGELGTLEFRADELDTLEVDLQRLYDAVYREAADAYLDTEAREVVKSVQGVSFDMDKAQRSYEAAKNGEKVSITLVYTEPAITTAALEAMLYRDELHTKTTYLTNSYNRNNNVTLAAAAINGTILYPGDEFSYNGTVGERTTARGYLTAGAYVNGEVVDEVGGGICQVSSTIYYVALYCDLKITARENHQFVVSYLPIGLDATVNWGTTDFKFVNDTDYPIRIDCYVEGLSLTVTFYGTKTEEKTVEMRSEYLSSTPITVVEKVDDSLAAGETRVSDSGSTGYRVRTYRYVYDADGNEMYSGLESTSSYVMRSKVLLISPEDYVDPDAEPVDGVTDDPGAEPTDAGGDVTDDPDAGATEPVEPTEPANPEDGIVQTGSENGDNGAAVSEDPGQQAAGVAEQPEG